jgi:2C-methyl-D-erythritol 2,4-cyclodiphosphate synthase
MVKVNKLTKMDVFIKELIKMIKNKDMVSVNTQIVDHIKVIGPMANSMVKALSSLLKVPKEKVSGKNKKKMEMQIMKKRDCRKREIF